MSAHDAGILFALLGSSIVFTLASAIIAHLRINAINHRIDRAVSAARQRRDHRGRFTKS